MKKLKDDDELRKLLSIGKKHRSFQIKVLLLGCFSTAIMAPIPFLINYLISGMQTSDSMIFLIQLN